MGIKINNVTMKYDKFEAVQNISIDVAEGTIHGLIGENGSGKTTLIKCIMGIYKPEKGEILIDGENVYENPKVKARMGYVADSNKYFSNYRLGKMAEFFRDVYEKFDMNKLKELNEIFKLDMNKRVSELSKGQQMRFAFMLNIAANTDILILDEPTSGIDAVAKNDFFSVLIKEVEERNLTVIISSHNIMELEKICDSVTIIKHGKIISQNVMDEVISNVRKFNFAFSDGIPEEFFKHDKIIKYNNFGNICTVMYEGLTDSEFEKILLFNPSFYEELRVNLEEVFVNVIKRDPQSGKMPCDSCSPREATFNGSNPVYSNGGVSGEK